MHEALNNFPVCIETAVTWGEMDFFQHVNNIYYFRYFESARIQYFKDIDLMKIHQEQGIGPILANTYCRFRKPLTHPDTLRVGARITQYQPDRFIHEYCVVSEKLNAVAAEGTGEIFAFDYRKNARGTFPDQVKQMVEQLERRTF